MRKLAATLAIAAASLSAAAQHPFSTRWQAVETGQYKLIYPDYLRADAARVASAIGTAIKADTASLCPAIKKIPVMMSGSSTTSNGYATQFPYMLMLYAKPSDSNEMSTMDWYQNLVSHEMRHIAQYNTLDQGFTKLAHWLAGSYGWGGLSYSVPQWWYEGDAVYAETVSSSTGRGRSALFEMPLQALLCSRDKIYPYDKMLHGSYRDMVPSQYLTGYLMTTKARLDHGADIWRQTARRMSWYSFWPWAFGAGYRHESGQSVGKLYKSAMSDLRQIYTRKSENSETISPINKARKRCFTSYKSPMPIAGGKILCLKSSLSRPSRFVAIDTASGQETSLGAANASAFDTDGHTAVFASGVPDIRWSERSYSDIAAMDIATGRKQMITKKQKYFMPCISPSGQRIAAVEFTQDRKCSLAILSLEKHGRKYSATLQASYAAGSPQQPYEYIRMPRFAGEGKIAYISTSRNMNAIKLLDISTMQSETILPYTSSNIYSLAADNDGNIFIASDLGGVCNIYRISQDGKLHQCTKSKDGALNPTISDSTLIFSQYSAMGYDIASCSKMRDIEQQQPCPTLYMEPLIDDSQVMLNFVACSQADSSALSGARKYRQLSDPFKYIGWMPEISLGHASATAYTTNYLGTLNVGAQITRYFDPGYTRGAISATYSGFYPVLSVSASFGDTGEEREAADKLGRVSKSSFVWREHVLQGTVSLPLNLSRMHYNQSLTFTAGIQYYIVRGYDMIRMDKLRNGEFPMAGVSASYSWSRKSASRDFKSPLSFSASASRTQSASSRLESGISTFSAGMCTRLFAPQTYLSISGTIVRQDEISNKYKSYVFNSSAFSIYGYSDLRLQNISRLSGEFAFPLGYPDIGIPSILWIKRLRASIVGDIAKGDLLGIKLDYASAGIKVVADFCALRLNYDISAGFGIFKGFKENGLEGTEYGLLLSLPF